MLGAVYNRNLDACRMACEELILLRDEKKNDDFFHANCQRYKDIAVANAALRSLLLKPSQRQPSLEEELNNHYTRLTQLERSYMLTKSRLGVHDTRATSNLTNPPAPNRSHSGTGLGHVGPGSMTAGMGHGMGMGGMGMGHGMSHGMGHGMSGHGMGPGSQDGMGMATAAAASAAQAVQNNAELARLLRVAEHTESIGAQTLNTLAGQREQLQRDEAGLRTISSIVTDSNAVINRVSNWWNQFRG